MTKKQKRDKLARMVAARSYLRIALMLPDGENDRLHKKIMKWQDDNQIEISQTRINTAIKKMHSI